MPEGGEKHVCLACACSARCVASPDMNGRMVSFRGALTQSTGCVCVSQGEQFSMGSCCRLRWAVLAQAQAHAGSHSGPLSRKRKSVGLYLQALLESLGAAIVLAT